ncbi:GumC family protein [Egbenema bharatensis]|uniref:GumC family protein n=1 Tax=Egbenema bharatensis TaxID=3463334 RepID=UPI003A8C84AD
MTTEERLHSQTAAPLAPGDLNEDEIDLGKIFSTLRRRALLIIAVASAVTIGAGVQTSFEDPVFESKVEILIQRTSAEQEVTSSLPDAIRREQTDTGISNPDLLRVLTSNSLMTPVVEKLQQQYPGMCEQIISSDDETLDLASLTAVEQVDRCRGIILSNLNAEIIEEESDIIRVTYKGMDPDEVRAILDLAADEYLEYSLEYRLNEIQRGIQFVEGKLPDLRENVALLQDQLQQLRQRYNLITPDARGEELSLQVRSFREQFLQSQVELEQTRESVSNLQGELSGTSPEVAASGRLSQNARYQRLVGELLDLDAEIAQASTLYLDTTPEMEVLLERRQSILGLLSREGQIVQGEASGQLRELEVRDQALQSTLGTLRSDVDDLAVITRIYTDIDRELTIATETLNQFLAKREVLQIDAAQREIPWLLLTPTTDPEPIVSSLPRNLAIGGILGVMLGIGLALAIEALTDVVHNPNDLKRITRLPVLGSIPANRSAATQFSETSQADQLSPAGSAIVPTQRSGYERDPFAEAFRSLYTNIRLLNSDDPIQSIVITSTQPGEGKSTTAIHLAKAAAAMSQRVLLVDTDLRNPSLHEYLDLRNTGGLTDVMSGDLLLREAVRQANFETNLFILPAGVVPPDPTRLLSSKKMQRLMEQFQDNFELVIYDAPPLVGFADAYITSAHADGLVLVAEMGKLKSSSLEQAMEQTKVAKIPVLGVVSQKVKA